MDRNTIKHNGNHRELEDYQIQLMHLEQKYQQMVLDARRSGKSVQLVSAEFRL